MKDGPPQVIILCFGRPQCMLHNPDEICSMPLCIPTYVGIDITFAVFSVPNLQLNNTVALFTNLGWHSSGEFSHI